MSDKLIARIELPSLSDDQVKALTDVFIKTYQNGKSDAIDEFLESIKSCDLYGNHWGLFRLSKGQEKDYVPYIKFEDVIKVAEQIKENKDD